MISAPDPRRQNNGQISGSGDDNGFVNSDFDARPSLDLRSLLVSAWRGRWLLLTCCGLSIAACVAYFSYARPLYRASAMLLVEEHGMPLQGRPPSSRDSTALMLTQAEIVRSRSVLEGARAEFPAFVLEPTVLDPVLAVTTQLSVVPIPGSNVLSMSFDGPVGEENEKLLHGIIASYRQFVNALDYDAQQETLRFLTRNEEDLRAQLEEREVALLKLRQENPLVGGGHDGQGMLRDLLDTLGKTLTQVRTRRIELESELEALGPQVLVQNALHSRPVEESRTSVAPGKDAELSNVAAGAAVPLRLAATSPASGESTATLRGVAQISVSSPDGLDGTTDLQSMRLHLCNAQAKEKELLATYGSKHPQVAAVQAEIAARETTIREVLHEAPNIMRQKLEAARHNEQQISLLYEQELKKIKAVESHLLKEQFARDALDRLEAVHKPVLAQLQQWQLASEASGGPKGVKVAMLQAPVQSKDPVWPKKLLLLAIAATLGMTGGLGMTLLLEQKPSKAASCRAALAGNECQVAAEVASDG